MVNLSNINTSNIFGLKTVADKDNKKLADDVNYSRLIAAAMIGSGCTDIKQEGSMTYIG